MKLFLLFLSAFMSFASEDSIQQKISKVEEKMKNNPNFGLISGAAGSGFLVRLNIPFGTNNYYGTHSDPAIAREAVLMIVREYFKSLKLMKDGTLKSPASFDYLKLKYNSSFSGATSIDAQISKFEKNIKNYEKNPNIGLISSRGGYVVQPTIPPPNTHWYGIQFHQKSAQQAILILAKEYLKSLKLVKDGKLESPATAQDLQLKYNEIVSKWKPQNMISKFKITLKKIEKNPNFGVTFRPYRYIVQLSVPPGARHWYGSHQEHATARRAVLMIAHEYMKSLELVRNEKAKVPASASDLQLKYRTEFGEFEEKSNTAEKKVDVASEHKLLMNHERPKQAKYAPTTPVQQTLLKSIDDDSAEDEKNFINKTKTYKARKCNTIEKADKFIDNIYKVSRVWENWEEHEPENFHIMGFFQIMDGSEAFSASAIKKVDGRLYGYCEEHRAWVNLEWSDTCFDTSENDKVKENFKRKREQKESSIWQNGWDCFDYCGSDNDL